AGSFSLLDKQAGATNVTLSATEQTIYSYSLAGGSLSTDRTSHVTLYGTLLNNSGANRTYTIKINYGGTTMFGDVTPNVAAAATITSSANNATQTFSRTYASTDLRK